MTRRCTAAITIVLSIALAGSLAVDARAQTPGTWHVVGWNNLGMHCMDAQFSTFAILPPYNTVLAHVFDGNGQLVTDPSGLTVTYRAVADPSGSINTTSQGKTDFWDHVFQLFGANLPVDAGLVGKDMPGPGNPPKAMSFDATRNWFIAEGIPITPYDDGGGKNPYPLMRLEVRNAAGTLLASTDVVLPVSDEMDCAACHASGSGPAARPAAGWVFDSDPQRDYRLNILRLHDDRQLGQAAYQAALAAAGYRSDGLYATVTVGGTAVLCARCHASEALPGSGYAGIPQLTTSMHASHSSVLDPTNGLSLDSSDNRSACYRCHPGAVTKCLRGAMGNAVAADGTMAIQCQACHGSMSRVGAATRTGWFDEPNCQGCHTGTATHNSGQIRYTSVFDSSGNPRVPADTTFATNPDTPASGVSLYRFSSGHGGVQCAACHGSTHAEYPSSHRNDNLQNIALQGHVGTIGECASCHNTVPQTVSGGPHGMHPVGQSWIGGHKDPGEHNRAACQACHGGDYRGTVLSRSFANRSISAFGTKTFWRGFQIGCYTCHNGPGDEHSNPNHPAVVSNLSAGTDAGVPVTVQLQATDADNNTLTLRIVSQPAGGTVGLSGTAATYYPFPGFTGTDTFTYAAWDGSTDSNLAQVTVNVAALPCTLACSASGPTTVVEDTSVQFQGSATPSSCDGTPQYSWDFGDGSTGSAFQNPAHTYTTPGTYHWTMTASVGSVSCSRSGDITVTAATPCTLDCSASAPASAVEDTSVQFQGSATPSSCDGTPEYVWDFGDGSGGSTNQNPSHTYAAPGTYHWTMTAAIGSVSCSRSGDITITAAGTCTVECSATVPTSARPGQEVRFAASASTSGCDGTPRYRWSFGDGKYSDKQNATHTYRRPGTYTWTLTVTVGSTTCTRTGTITVAYTPRKSLSRL